MKEKEKIIEWSKGLITINTKKLEYENLIYIYIYMYFLNKFDIKNIKKFILIIYPFY